MDNEYDYLRKEALRRSNQGREAIIHAERKFYNAMSRIKEALCRSQYPKYIEETIEQLGDYPAVLRSVMDAEDEANNMLLRATQIRREERFARQLDGYWIAVADGLPESFDSCLCLLEAGGAQWGQDLCCYDSAHGWSRADGTPVSSPWLVTHWMRIPERPKRSYFPRTESKKDCLR